MMTAMLAASSTSFEIQTSSKVGKKIFAFFGFLNIFLRSFHELLVLRASFGCEENHKVVHSVSGVLKPHKNFE